METDFGATIREWEGEFAERWELRSWGVEERERAQTHTQKEEVDSVKSGGREEVVGCLLTFPNLLDSITYPLLAQIGNGENG